FQLVRNGIKVFNPKEEGTWYDADGVAEKFGVPPGLVVDVLALMGDTIDNIKGVPGIGEKGARELVAQYGSLDALIEHAAEVKNKRYREGLLANIENARQSRELARIRTSVPVEFDAEAVRYRGGPLEAVLDALRPVLEDEALAKIGHDLKFDAIVLARHGITLRGLETDTMLASFLLDSSRAEHRLEDLALEHTSYKALSEEDVCGR